MSYKVFRDGYGIEYSAAGGTYGTSVIDGAGDSWFLPGIISQQSKHPNVSWDSAYRATGVGEYEVPAGAAWKVYKARQGYWGIIMQNGVPLWMAQGGSSTAASVHTITPSWLPSFTIHHERTGTGTDWAIQWRGCMVMNLAIECGTEVNFLRADIDWVAQDGVDPNIGGTNAMMTNEPALPATATTTPYLFSQLTRTWDKGDTDVALDGLTHVKLNIDPGLMPLLANYTDGAGADLSHKPLGYYEHERRKYRVELNYHPGSDDIWDELVTHNTSNTEDLYLKWTKSANDYIEITCVDCLVLDNETNTPAPDGDKNLQEPVILEPRALTISVKDAVTAAGYGE